MKKKRFNFIVTPAFLDLMESMADKKGLTIANYIRGLVLINARRELKISEEKLIEFVRGNL